MYIYFIYIYSRKLSQTFLWISKFDVKLRVGKNHFRNYPICVSFQIFGSKLVFFCCASSSVLKLHPFFQKILKPDFASKIQS